jgi:hypothetical protein
MAGPLIKKSYIKKEISMKTRKILLFSLALSIIGLFGFWLAFDKAQPATAEPDIYASPVHAGCYIAAPSDCRIHVEPFTINIQSGSKLIYFQLVAWRIGAGTSQVIYDFRPDLSNPLPYSGTVVTPSLVAQDYAAQCGATYSISLQGQDTLDQSAYNLGSTGQFTCPTNVP